jgi:hypothetical protein
MDPSLFDQNFRLLQVGWLFITVKLIHYKQQTAQARIYFPCISFETYGVSVLKNISCILLLALIGIVF